MLIENKKMKSNGRNEGGREEGRYKSNMVNRHKDKGDLNSERSAEMPVCISCAITLLPCVLRRQNLCGTTVKHCT